MNSLEFQNTFIRVSYAAEKLNAHTTRLKSTRNAKLQDKYPSFIVSPTWNLDMNHSTGDEI